MTYPAPIEQVMTPIDQSQLRPRRQRLLQRARGRVLELGGAGGVNLEHYPADRVSEVVVVGADGASRARLRRTAARRGVSVDLRTAAQVGTGYDTVVAAFTLSALSDLDRELDALRQLLAPDGRLLFLDHSPRRPAGRGHRAEPAALAADGRRLRPRPRPAGRGPAAPGSSSSASSASA